MALSALDDLTVTPTDEQVAHVIGDSLGARASLREWLESCVGVDHWQWGSSGKQYGWALRAKVGGRRIPAEGRKSPVGGCVVPLDTHRLSGTRCRSTGGST